MTTTTLSQSLPVSAFTSSRYEEKTSQRFQPITTANAVSALQSQGWDIFKAEQARTRKVTRIPYVRHQVQLTHPDIPSVDGLRPVIYLQNANDGTSSFQLFAGLFRFICSNGLVVGSSFLSASVRHTGERETVTGRLMEKTWEVASGFPKVMEKIEAMRSYTMTNEERASFSFLAFQLRYPDNVRDFYEGRVGFTPRREEDQGEDLWRVFNRTQEDLITGGFLARNRRARGIRSLVRSTKVNRALWDLTEKVLSGEVNHEATMSRIRRGLKQQELGIIS